MLSKSLLARKCGIKPSPDEHSSDAFQMQMMIVVDFAVSR